MASSKVWLRREQLRSLIALALDEIGYEGGNVSIAVSPNLDEVYATTEPWWDDDSIGTDVLVDIAEWMEENKEDIFDYNEVIIKED